MRDYLITFLRQQGYIEKDISVLLNAYDAIQADPVAERWDELVACYDRNAEFSISDGLAHIRAAREIADGIQIHRYTIEFLLFLCMSRTLKRRYKERGIDESVFVHTMRDLYYKSEECKAMYDIVGSFVSDWFIGFFILSRFGFGRLQFELIPFGKEFENEELSLCADSRVINIHIPRTGTPLTPQACEEAYAQAAAFFRDELQDEIVFHCSSWLLYPEHEHFLPESSNLLSFAERFTIIESGEYGDDHPNLWRLFDQPYHGDPKALPEDSSLRRAYKKWLLEGNKTGWGTGVFVY
jgi:hypothetical protein